MLRCYIVAVNQPLSHYFLYNQLTSGFRDGYGTIATPKTQPLTCKTYRKSTTKDSQMLGAMKKKNVIIFEKTLFPLPMFFHYIAFGL